MRVLPFAKDPDQAGQIHSRHEAHCVVLRALHSRLYEAVGNAKSRASMNRSSLTLEGAARA